MPPPFLTFHHFLVLLSNTSFQGLLGRYSAGTLVVLGVEGAVLLDGKSWCLLELSERSTDRESGHCMLFRA